jgi:plasmid stabilization system protein ParE
MRRVVYTDSFVDDADRIAAEIETRLGIRPAEEFRDNLNWFCEVVASQPRIGKQNHGYATTLYGIVHDVNWIFFQFDNAEARFVHIVDSRREKRNMSF